MRPAGSPEVTRAQMRMGPHLREHSTKRCHASHMTERMGRLKLCRFSSAELRATFSLG